MNVLTCHAEEPLFSPEEQATANVDALVNDDIQMMGRDISVVPPIYEQPRRATPTIPPGFSAPIAHRALNEYSTPPMSRTASSDITPALPLVPITPLKMPSSQRPRRQGDVVSTPGAPASAANTRPSSPVKRSEKSSSGKSQTMPGVCTAETVELTTQPEESKTKAVVAESPSKPTARSKSGNKKGKDVPAAEATPTKAVKDNTLAIVSKETKDNTPVPTLRKDAKELAPPATPASTSKRQHPGKLDLAVATELLEPSQKHVSSPLKSDTPSKAGRTVSVPLTASSSVPASPAATSTGSPIKRAAAPRTIRVVPTPRTETPPALPAVSTGPPHVPTVDKLRSRQASIASINQPGTPASELISEDASIITSASVSRASSPPLIGGKVGSAPVRKKTKSQAKKERQERARQMLEEQTLALEEQAKAEPEPEHAPIVGRKTKKRKSTANAPKAPAGPAKTQTTSLKDGPTDESEESEPKHPPAPVTGAKNEVDALPSQSSIERTPSSPPLETGPKEKANLSAQAIIADLQKSGELLASTLEFFKPLSSSLAHAVRTAPQSGAPTAPQDAKLHFTQADLEALAKKQPVRLSGPDGNPDSRYLITPQGKFLWGLTKELEDKALELEKHIEELKGPARFHPQQHTPHVPSAAPHAQSGDVLPAIATALKEAGAKLKSGSAAAAVQSMPKIDPSVQNTHQAPAPQQQAPVDAGAYLNQFVLPGTDNPTPNTTRTDMCGVGGPPGAGAGNTSVNIGKIAKAAKVVAEGGTLSNELEGMGVMAADLLGGVVVQGLEWLMNAGLGTNIHQDLSVDGKGNITLGGNGFDVQGLVDAMGSAGGLAGVEAAQGRRGRRSVLSVNEAEQAMLAAKKEYEALEKKLAALMKRNRKLVGATK